MRLPCKNVELKVGDEVVASEVDGRLQGHGFEAGSDGMDLAQGYSKNFPRNYRPEIKKKALINSQHNQPIYSHRLRHNGKITQVGRRKFWCRQRIFPFKISAKVHLYTC